MGKYIFILQLEGILYICMLWILVEHGVCYMPQYAELLHRPGQRRLEVDHQGPKESTKHITVHQRIKEGLNTSENHEHKKVSKIPHRPSVTTPSFVESKNDSPISVGHAHGGKPDPKLFFESGRRGLLGPGYPASKIVRKMNRTVPELAPKQLDDDYDDDISIMNPRSQFKTSITRSNLLLQMRQGKTSDSSTISTTKKKDTEWDDDDDTTNSKTSTKKKDTESDNDDHTPTTTSKKSTKKKDTEWDNEDDDDGHKSTPAWETVKPITKSTSKEVTEMTKRNTDDWETVNTKTKKPAGNKSTKTTRDREEMSTHNNTKPPPHDKTTAQDGESSKTEQEETSTPNSNETTTKTEQEEETSTPNSNETTTQTDSSTKSAQTNANETTTAQQTDSGKTSGDSKETVSGVQTKRCGCPVTNATTTSATTTSVALLLHDYYNYTAINSQNISFRIMQETTVTGVQTKRCGCPIANGASSADLIDTTKDCSCPSVVPTRPCGCEMKPEEMEEEYAEDVKCGNENVEKKTKPKFPLPKPPRLRGFGKALTKECGCPKTTTMSDVEEVLNCSHQFERMKGFRDVGAARVEISDYPYLVEINFKDTHHCVGTLFTTRMVLTAAHCCYKVGILTRNFIKRPVRFHPGELFVLLGSSDRTPGFYEKTHERRGVVAVLPHEKYDPWTVATYDYDFGLLLLTHEVVLTNSIKLVELKLPADPMPTNKTRCTVVGWGVPENVLQTGCTGTSNDPLKDANKEVSPYLMKIEMRYLDRCEKEAPPAHICATWKEKQACMGDSGSPFVCVGQQMALVGKACQSRCPGHFYRLDNEWQIQWLVRSASNIESLVSEAFGLTGFSNFPILFLTLFIRMF